MQLFQVLVVAITAGAVILHVSLIAARSRTDSGMTVSPATQPPPPPPPPSPPSPPPLGACARYTQDPRLFEILRYLENTCEDDVTEASCVAENQNQTVFWADAKPCSDAVNIGGYGPYPVTPRDKFFSCCPAGMMLVVEREDVQISGTGGSNDYGNARRVCVDIRMGPFPRVPFPTQNMDNRVIVTYHGVRLDSQTTSEGDTCAEFNTGFLLTGPLTSDITALEILNADDVCQACIVAGANVAVPSCALDQCDFPFAQPSYVPLPYIGPCARYRTHPTLPGYNNTCTMTTEANCTAAPGELVEWPGLLSPWKCRDVATMSAIDAERSAFIYCPAGYMLLNRTEGGRNDFWCLDPTAPFTGYAGDASYSFYTGATLRTFAQTTNLGTIAGFYTGTLQPNRFVRDTTKRYSTTSAPTMFFAPVVTAV